MKKSQKGFVTPLIIILVLLISGTGFYFLSTKKDITSPGLIVPNEKTNWKTYTNKDYNFTLSYPSNWTISDRSYDDNGRAINIVVIGPSRLDFPNHLGYEVNYSVLISGSADTQKLSSFSGRGCFFTKDPKYRSGQSSCNANVSRETEENSPEQKIAAQIFSTFKFNNEKSRPTNIAHSITNLYPERDENRSIEDSYIIGWRSTGLMSTDELRVGFRNSNSSTCWYSTTTPITIGQYGVDIKPSEVRCAGSSAGLVTNEKYKIVVVVEKYDSGKGVADESGHTVTFIGTIQCDGSAYGNKTCPADFICMGVRGDPRENTCIRI